VRIAKSGNRRFREGTGPATILCWRLVNCNARPRLSNAFGVGSIVPRAMLIEPFQRRSNGIPANLAVSPKSNSRYVSAAPVHNVNIESSQPSASGVGFLSVALSRNPRCAKSSVFFRSWQR